MIHQFAVVISQNLFLKDFVLFYFFCTTAMVNQTVRAEERHILFDILFNQLF